jgi:hypothetical protein
MSFELILRFLRPIEPLLVDESISVWGRRVVREVLALKGYDRAVKRVFWELTCEVDHESA